jgi:hypothetical protein
MACHDWKLHTLKSRGGELSLDIFFLFYLITIEIDNE